MLIKHKTTRIQEDKTTNETKHPKPQTKNNHPFVNWNYNQMFEKNEMSKVVTAKSNRLWEQKHSFLQLFRNTCIKKGQIELLQDIIDHNFYNFSFDLHIQTKNPPLYDSWCECNCICMYVPISIYLSAEVMCDLAATKTEEKLTLWQTSDFISLRARSENTQPQFLKKQNLQKKDNKTYNMF